MDVGEAGEVGLSMAGKVRRQEAPTHEHVSPLELCGKSNQVGREVHRKSRDTAAFILKHAPTSLLSPVLVLVCTEA